MKNFKNIILQLPEYYILIVVFLTDFTPPFNFNLISVGLGVIVFLQIIFQNRMTGMFIATLFLLINLYMPFALMWEFRNITSANSGSMYFLLTGFSIILLNLLFSSLMIYKYIKQEEKATDTSGIKDPFQNSNVPDDSGKAISTLETELYHNNRVY